MRECRGIVSVCGVSRFFTPRRPHVQCSLCRSYRCVSAVWADPSSPPLARGAWQCEQEAFDNINCGKFEVRWWPTDAVVPVLRLSSMYTHLVGSGKGSVYSACLPTFFTTSMCSLCACRIFPLFQYWAVPRGTAIRGQPVEGARQASASLPLNKNRDNLIAVRWTAF